VERPSADLETLDHAFALVQVLAHSGPSGASAARLASELGMPRRTVYRYLNSLLRLGMAESTGLRTATYRLGPTVDTLSAAACQQREFLRQSTLSVDSLAQATGQHIRCTVFDQGSVVTVAVASGAGAADQRPVTTVVGNRRPAHATASGKVFLAFLKGALDAYVTRDLTRRTRRTITDPARLREECRRVRQLGYGTDNHEFTQGVCCFAVPVWGKRRQVVGALSTSWETDGDIHISESHLAAVKAAARDFSKSIGGEPL
jgi:DNA-binding IclR family transcriptional regulator